MPAEGFSPVQHNEFRGLVTLPTNKLQVPAPFSPDCKNVQFGKGGVRTRPGLTTMATFATQKILSIKDYTLLDSTLRRVLVLTNNGTLYKETGGYTFTTVTANLIEAAVAPNLRMNSATLFGREYFGLAQTTASIPGVGYGVPHAFDDTNVYPVAPSGPAVSLGLAEGAASGDINQVSAGVHNYRVCFRTIWGFITPPSRSVALTSTGGKQVNVTNLPIGPAYVVGRVICATPASNTSDFFFIPGTTMDIRNNVDTTATIQFLDTALIAGTGISVRSSPQSDLLNCSNLGQMAGCFAYHNRLAWFGGQATYHLIGDNGFRNLAFDGSFINGRPFSWSELVAGESKGAPAGFTGEGLTLTGNGVTMSGVLENAGSTFLSVLPAGVNIHARIRCRATAGVVNSSSEMFRIYFATSTGDAATVYGNVGAYGSVKGNQMSSTEWRWINTRIMDISQAGGTLTTLNTLRIAATANVSNGEAVYIDRIELYSDSAQYENSLIRWSRANQPDAYDDLLGIMNVGPNDGQDVQGGFSIGENCYIVKTKSLYVTRDDGFNEPANWTVSLLSNTKGSPSKKGWGLGDRWAVIASRTGLHYFNGYTFKLLSDDIRNTWQLINWQYGWKLFVTVDIDRRRITVAAPYNLGTEATTELVYEYFDEGPDGRHEWNIWDRTDSSAVTCSTTSERSDGTRHVLYGTNHANGLIARIDDTVTGDFATPIAINSYYTFAAYGPDGARGLWGYLGANVQGSGKLITQGFASDATTVINAANRGPGNVTLQAAFPASVEWTVDVAGDRIFWQVGTNGVTAGVGDWFTLQEFVQYVKKKPYTPQRGLRGLTVVP